MFGTYVLGPGCDLNLTFIMPQMYFRISIVFKSNTKQSLTRKKMYVGKSIEYGDSRDIQHKDIILIHKSASVSA